MKRGPLMYFLPVAWLNCRLSTITKTFCLRWAWLPVPLPTGDFNRGIEVSTFDSFWGIFNIFLGHIGGYKLDTFYSSLLNKS